MKQYGFYSYKKEDTNIKTLYTIEFTRNKKVFDIMGTSKFDYSLLNTLKFDYLQDAINTYNMLYYDETCLHVLMLEQIILNDEIILEQFKDMISFNILPQHIQKRISEVEIINNHFIEQTEKIESALSKYGLTINKLIS